MSRTKLIQGVQAAKRLKGSGIVVRGGRRVAFWGDQAKRYTLYSATKSFGTIALGLAVGDGLTTLDTPVQPALPELTVPVPDANSAAWLPLVTLERLGTHSAGFDKPGGIVPFLFEPGTRWSYSDSGPNWIGDYLTVRFGQDLATVLGNRVFTPLGISAAALTWRANSYRPRTLRGLVRREFGSGINANVDALARIGLFLLRGGRWSTGQILPAGFVAAATAPRASIAGLPLHDPLRYPGAPDRYGLLVWTNADGTMAGVPTDAYWAWGLGDQLIVVVPSLDLVVVRAGPNGKRAFGDLAGPQSFLGPITQAVNRTNAAPVVNVGPDLTPGGAGTLALKGRIVEDGLPGAALTFGWTMVSGPAPVTFDRTNALSASGTFTLPGTYVLQLSVSDGQLVGADQVSVTVAAPPGRRASR